MLTAALLNIFLQVSAFSTWEKELHKIVFDPRYLLLNSEERKQVMLEPGETELKGCQSESLGVKLEVQGSLMPGAVLSCCLLVIPAGKDSRIKLQSLEHQPHSKCYTQCVDHTAPPKVICYHRKTRSGHRPESKKVNDTGLENRCQKRSELGRSGCYQAL